MPFRAEKHGDDLCRRPSPCEGHQALGLAHASPILCAPSVGCATGFLRGMLSCKATSNADKFHQAVFSDFLVQPLPRAQISRATRLGTRAGGASFKLATTRIEQVLLCEMDFSPRCRVCSWGPVWFSASR